MKLNRFLSWLMFAIVLIAFVDVVRDQIAYSNKLGNQLSHQADGGSELASINSGMHYYKLGFLINFGLPDLSMPGSKWYIDPNDDPISAGVYTHYPPGPNWMLGIGMHVCGVNNFPCYRKFPIFVGFVCLVLSYICVSRVIGSVLAAAFFLVLVRIPITTEMMHGLHHQGYAFSIFLLMMSYAWYLFSRERSPTLKEWGGLFFLGFLIGWLSFDYFFVTSLFPLAIFLLSRSKRSWLEAVKGVTASGGGWCFAMGLHFIQNALYFSTGHRATSWNFTLEKLSRGFSRAYDDLFLSAKIRAGAIAARPNSSFAEVVELYTGKFLPARTQAGEIGMYMIYAAAVLAVLFLLVSLIRGHRHGSLRSYAGLGMAMVVAYVISMLWVIVMRDHALDGTHMMFIPRHFILLIFTSMGVVTTVIMELIKAMGWSRK
ncbi:MAG: hypothetical protein ACK5Y6_04280 [Pseudomonadota bacterium]